MHKITKGLKKKKKGKKKAKEQELFDEAELERYRREHQEGASGEASAPSKTHADNEEWSRFNALTQGVDSILKKTQGDLDRIKSTSFFQRKKVQEEEPVTPKTSTQWVDFEEQQARKAALEGNKGENNTTEFESQAFGEVEEEEEEEEEEFEDIFDTSYVDVVTSGEVKLAYIPDSPEELTEEGGFDPFDTSNVESICRQAEQDKKKQLFSLGSAVEVLTGKAESIGSPRKTPLKSSRRRPRPGDQNLLFGSFDQVDQGLSTTASPELAPKSLLDEDPITVDSLLKEFEVFGSEPHPSVGEPPKRPPPVDIFANKRNNQEEEDEFAQLAIESVSKKNTETPNTRVIAPPTPDVARVLEDWSAFDNTNNSTTNETFDEEAIQEIVKDIGADPFDTTFADNILPGKAELRLIENEILGGADLELNEARILSNSDSFEFNPREGENLSSPITISSVVSIHITDPAGEVQPEEEEPCIQSLKPSHRDLLGGSTTDLSKICEDPIAPEPELTSSEKEEVDPFDTSVVDVITAPGKAELKYLEQELLKDSKETPPSINDLEDNDFDPRGSEQQLPFKSVSFDLPSPIKTDLLGSDINSSIASKPLTPYYSKPSFFEEGDSKIEVNDLAKDPFDTSFVSQIPPGKAEIKLLESELIDSHQYPTSNIKTSLSDQDFNPRDNEVDQEIILQPPVISADRRFSDISGNRRRPPTSLPLKRIIVTPSLSPIHSNTNNDLLTEEDDQEAHPSDKPLTPSVELDLYTDPFDTSIAANLVPGKAELKIIESELFSENKTSLTRSYTDQDFNPRSPVKLPNTDLGSTPADLFNLPDTSDPGIKPLTPCLAKGDSTEEVEFDDPFDTSIAANILPGKTELKLLESELIGQ